MKTCKRCKTTQENFRKTICPLCEKQINATVNFPKYLKQGLDFIGLNEIVGAATNIEINENIVIEINTGLVCDVYFIDPLTLNFI